MNRKDLFNGFNEVDDAILERSESVSQSKRKTGWIKWVSIAACLSLVIMGGISGSVFHSPNSPANGVASYFVITAHAANGEATDLSLAESFFNSSGEVQENAFGVDVSLFNFSVRPSNWDSNEALYSKFDVSVSYNGTLVENKDKHIMVGYLIPTPDSDEPWAYSVTGWFTEPTDIIITIMDKESREIVETTTVNVNYLADRQEYQLEVTELNTKYAEQKKAVEANEALMEYFFDQGYVSEYPAYFGGCYIEDNMLHIRLASPTDQEIEALDAILSNYKEGVVFEYVETSYAELQAYADEIANELITLGYGVTHWYVDSTKGNIVIGVLKGDLDAVAALIADRKADNLKNGFPEIIVEEGAYTVAE